MLGRPPTERVAFGTDCYTKTHPLLRADPGRPGQAANHLLRPSPLGSGWSRNSRGGNPSIAGRACRDLGECRLARPGSRNDQHSHNRVSRAGPARSGRRHRFRTNPERELWGMRPGQPRAEGLRSDRPQVRSPQGQIGPRAPGSGPIVPSSDRPKARSAPGRRGSGPIVPRSDRPRGRGLGLDLGLSIPAFTTIP